MARGMPLNLPNEALALLEIKSPVTGCVTHLLVICTWQTNSESSILLHCYKTQRFAALGGSELEPYLEVHESETMHGPDLCVNH